MPPLILLFAGVVGSVALARLVAKEARRINRELDEARERDLDKGEVAKLQRDPQTGAYRPN